MESRATSQPRQAAEPRLIVRAAADRQHYRQGDTAALAMVATPREESAAASFRTSQRFDFVVSAEGREVWRWSADRMFLQALGEETYRRDEPALYATTWDLTGSDGEPLPPGEYEVRGALATRPPVPSPPFRIEIAEPQE